MGLDMTWFNPDGSTTWLDVPDPFKPPMAITLHRGRLLYIRLRKRFGRKNRSARPRKTFFST